MVVCGCLRSARQAADTGASGDPHLQQAVLPPGPCFSIDLTFKQASSGTRRGAKAELTYEAVCSRAGAQPMLLCGTAKPQASEFKLDLGVVRIQPVLGDPQETNGGSICSVPGSYLVSVADPTGQALAEYVIDRDGYCVLKSSTLAPSCDAQLIATSTRSLHILYRRRPLGGDPEPLLGVEFTPNTYRTERTLSPGDGWTYRFIYPDGQLKLYHGTCLGSLPTTLAHIADEEGRARRKEFDSYWCLRESQRREPRGVKTVWPPKGDSSGSDTGGGGCDGGDEGGGGGGGG